jgi:hypothetical protein
MTSITNPKYMSLLDWADRMCLDLDKFGAVGRLMQESEWQDWAVQFYNNSALGLNLPNPYSFDNWQDWAERFYQSLA